MNQKCKTKASPSSLNKHLNNYNVKKYCKKENTTSKPKINKRYFINHSKCINNNCYYSMLLLKSNKKKENKNSLNKSIKKKRLLKDKEERNYKIFSNIKNLTNSIQNDSLSVI